MTNISEHFRLAAKDWVEKDGAARMLDESKTSVLAQRISFLGDIPHNKAEREVKSSDEWQDYLKKMVEAKTAANLARVKMDFLRMKFQEWQSAEANARNERKMG
ncbi:MAG: hypothetical protein V3T23_09185 [Nitrososphaerales archaeon]